MYPRADNSMTKRDILDLASKHTASLPELEELSPRMRKDALILATNNAFARADAAASAAVHQQAAEVEHQSQKRTTYIVVAVILLLMLAWFVL